MEQSRNRASSSVLEGLARRILFKAGLRIAVVIVAGTAAGYYHMVRTLETQALGQIEKYVAERCLRESEIFRLAEDNHRILAAALVERLGTLSDAEAGAAFDRLVIRFPDGVWRNREADFDGTRQPCIFLDEKLVIDDDVRRRVVVFHELCMRYGPAWRSRFQDTYLHHPDGIMVLYWPERPRWCYEAGVELEIRDEEYSWVADQEHDIERRTVWTGMFLDRVAGLWMVSCETPVDIEGRHIATIGHDILLNELLERAVDDHLPQARNVLFRADGHLIARPGIMDQIEAGQGQLLVSQAGSADLESLFAAATSLPEGRTTAVNPANGAYLGVGRIKGPDWFFVVELPRKAISGPAARTARAVLLLGVVLLVTEILVLLLVLRRHVARPLGELVRATDAIAAGHMNVPINAGQEDELGRLAASVEHMRNVISDRVSALQTEVAERRRAEETLRQKNEELERFTYTVSHDLKSPLVTIQSFLGFLKKDLEAADQDRLWQDMGFIQNAVNKMNSLLDELLDLSRIGRKVNPPEDVMLQDLVKEALDLVAGRIAELGVVVAITEEPIVLNGDRVRLREVFQNLIDNAVKFMAQEPSPRLEIGCEQLDQETVLFVRDNGIGIDPRHINKLFNLFEKLHPEIEGTGMGLAMVKRIVEFHGGRIWAQSEGLGRGATFYLTLANMRRQAKTTSE